MSTSPQLIPSGYNAWWSTEIHLWWRDFDYLGHVTAASYGSLYEEAFGRFMTVAWGTEFPSYVVGAMSIRYLHEIVRGVDAVRVFVAIEQVGTASISARLVAVDSEGRECSTAENRYVAWDRDMRCSRPITSAERAGLGALTKPRS
ncbi:MAG: acyl-CoA thioesterase [Kribbellaceae bacterium]|nr:acyl-CoA thioesterase [Kribbellaceae bacterium]